MKNLALVCVICAAALASAIEPGSHRADVIKALGRPQGFLAKGEREILLYERGTVELLGDLVITAHMVSAEAAWNMKQARAAADSQAAQERSQRIAEGESEKTRMLSDASFTNKPAAEQAAAWQDFRRRYPEVAVDQQVSQVQTRQQAEQKAKAPEVKKADTEPKPKLSSSKRRKMKRTGGEETAEEGAPPPY